jgi:hypothetical protein
MKKRTMNELRQTKEYKLSDQGGEYTVPHKGAEPQRQTDLNGDHGERDSKLEECHQKLWGESYYNDPSEYDTEEDFLKAEAYLPSSGEPDYNWSGEKITLVDVEQEKLDKAAAEESKEFFPEDRKYITNAYHKQHVERDYIEEAKIEIVDKVVKHLYDVIFEMVCEEMGKKHVFQSQNYLTEAGFEKFEDQFFEFYHEHHGDILAQVQNKLIY